MEIKKPNVYASEQIFNDINVLSVNKMYEFLA